MTPLGGLLAAGVAVWPRPARIAPLGDAIVFVGLVRTADALWVSILVAATLVADDGDRLPLVVVALAGAASVALRIDWTILVGMLAIVTGLRALARFRSAAARPAHHR